MESEGHQRGLGDRARPALRNRPGPGDAAGEQRRSRVAGAGAGGTRADIDKVQQQIVDEQTNIRLLTATVATEEQPAHLATLSTQVLHWQPIAATHEIPLEALADVANAPAPKPALLATAPVAVDPTQPASAPLPAPAVR